MGAALYLNQAVTALTSAAKAELRAREDRWAPVAAEVAAWCRRYSAAEAAAQTVPTLQAAITWLKNATDDIRNARLAPLGDRAREIWAQLRQESNVDLGAIRLSGSGNRRQVDVNVTVDGSPGAELGVMSQSEVNALALTHAWRRSAADTYQALNKGAHAGHRGSLRSLVSQTRPLTEMKDALAVLDRRGVSVMIRSPHAVITTGRRPKEGFPDVVTLHALVSQPSDPGQVGTDITLTGVKDADVETARRFFLRYSDEKLLEATEYGDVLARSDSRQPARIYVKGLLVAGEPNFLFSYNITKLSAPLRRALNRSAAMSAAVPTPTESRPS